jgi:ABC-type sugar transport system ATPase subunit
MADVVLRGVSKAFGATPVLADIDLMIDDGELVVLVGPSGCGKSTLLRLIAGLEELTHGEILIGGRRVDQLPPQERGVAMMFQSYALYPHMTAYENMSFGLSLARHDRATIDARVTKAASLLQITALLERKPAQLSGGERQRVALGRAIVREPAAFLLDEPLSNLDAALRARTRLELSNLHRQLGATMIYVTHDQLEAMTLAERLVVLREGRVEQIGAPLEVYRRPRNAFVAGFLGLPTMNFLEARVASTGPARVTCELAGGSRLQAEVDGRRLGAGDAITLGIRPEHLRATGTATPLAGPIASIEHVGDSSIVYVEMSGARGGLLVARFDADASVRLGDRLALEALPHHVHVFDAGGIACRAAGMP